MGRHGRVYREFTWLQNVGYICLLIAVAGIAWHMIPSRSYHPTPGRTTTVGLNLEGPGVRTTPTIKSDRVDDVVHAVFAIGRR